MTNLLLPTGSMIILILTPGASCILRGTSILLGWCTAILNLETSSWTAVVRRPQRCGKFSWLKDRPKAYKSNLDLWKRGIDDVFMVLVLRSTRNIHNLLRFLDFVSSPGIGGWLRLGTIFASLASLNGCALERENPEIQCLFPRRFPSLDGEIWKNLERPCGSHLVNVDPLLMTASIAAQTTNGWDS